MDLSSVSWPTHRERERKERLDGIEYTCRETLCRAVCLVLGNSVDVEGGNSARGVSSSDDE